MATLNIRLLDFNHSEWRLNVEEVIALHRRRIAPEEVTVAGLRFEIYPEVFSPLIAPSGMIGLAFSALPFLRGKIIADVGCGSGIIASLLALNGAKKVICSDTSAPAIQNSLENVERHSLANVIDVRHGSTLAVVEPSERIEIVFADLPFCHKPEIEDELDSAFYDPDLHAISEFLDRLTLPQYHATRSFVCLSNLDALNFKNECRTRGLRYRTFMTLDLDWIALSLYEIRQQGLIKQRC
jgi:methylase of polypeptide subunit release factors